MNLLAEILTWTFYIYLVLGLAAGVWFVTIGIARIDDSASTGSAGFRATVGAASIVLWPAVVALLVRGKMRS